MALPTAIKPVAVSPNNAYHFPRQQQVPLHTHPNMPRPETLPQHLHSQTPGMKRTFTMASVSPENPTGPSVAGSARRKSSLNSRSEEEPEPAPEELTTKGRKRKRLAKACSACHVSIFNACGAIILTCRKTNVVAMVSPHAQIASFHHGLAYTSMQQARSFRRRGRGRARGRRPVRLPPRRINFRTPMPGKQSSPRHPVARGFSSTPSMQSTAMCRSALS